jgi:glycosyltransferase involved in cell wall biosynthesis
MATPARAQPAFAPAAADAESTGRICFVTDDFAGVVRNGGIGTHFLLMSRLLAARGWDVHVLFCGPVDDVDATVATPALLAAEGITFSWLDDELPVWHGVPHFGDGTGTLVASQQAFEALERLHAEFRFDIIEFSDWRALGFRSIQAKRAGIAFGDTRLAVKLHSTTAWQRRGNCDNLRSPWELKVEHCERYAFEHADLQLSPSAYMLRDAREHGWAVREDATVSYPFPARQAPARAAAPGGVQELVFFGRLERRKGLDLFLSALDLLPGHPPVLFLGRDSQIDGRDASDIVAERMAGRPHRIETGLDREAAIAELLAGDRLAVLASRSETFGFTVAECIADEIPFLAADVGGIPEVVALPQARERWLFEPSAEALAAALERRLVAPEEEEAELRAQTAAACDPHAWNDRVAATYGQLARRPSRAPRGRGDRTDPGTGTVTVAVTHHHHPAYLPAALASLAAQEHAPHEVFVIDDGSTDPAALQVFAEQEAKYPDWCFLRQPNAGPGAARNACLERATGEFVLPFDSDNVARPELLGTLLAAMADGRDVATCHMLAFVADEDIAAGRFAFRFAPTGGPRLLTVIENVFGDTCGLFRTSALRAVGGFETVRWSPHEDWETYTKLAFAGYEVDVVPRVLFFYRTAVGGRLDTLSGGAAEAHRLRRRMIHELLAEVELTKDERVLLLECLLGFADAYELKRLERDQNELLEWATQERVDLEAWHRGQLEELRDWLTPQLEAATARAESAEAQLAAASAGVRATGGPPGADGAAPPATQLRAAVTSLPGAYRAARAILRRVRARGAAWRRADVGDRRA